MTTAIVLFLRPWLALAVFAAIVIPLRIAILRLAPPATRRILQREVSHAAQWGIWVVMMAAIIGYASFASG